jgi:hypothetical protein
MIKIEHVEVYGWEAAIRGARNAMNSWDKSDSGWRLAEGEVDYDGKLEYHIGPNDLKLMRSLIKAGDDHGKAARYLGVLVDITAPLYWWKEFRTYRKGRKFMDDGDDFTDVDDLEMHIEMNSCSTMHKIHEKAFTLDDFSHEHLGAAPEALLQAVCNEMNHWRSMFLDTGAKEYWWQMIQLLPSSYNQKRTVKLNYQALKRMYNARKNHKLDEWREVCKWIESLPYSELITG